MNTNIEKYPSNSVNHLIVINGHTENEQIDWSTADIQELKYNMLLLALDELKDNRRSKPMKAEAWKWLMIEDQSDNPFSADNCCEALEMNINTIRSFVQDLQNAGVIKL